MEVEETEDPIEVDCVGFAVVVGNWDKPIQRFQIKKIIILFM